MKQIRHANKVHADNLTRNERIGLWITQHVGTMQCTYIFCGIGFAALIGALTNWEIGILCGLASSQVIQLILLPSIMVGTNVQSKHDGVRADLQFEMETRIERQMQNLLRAVSPIYTTESEISPDALKRFLDGGEVRMPNTHISKPYNQYSLRRALTDNRTKQSSGSGVRYWDSVLKVIEKELNLHPSV